MSSHNQITVRQMIDGEEKETTLTVVLYSDTTAAVDIGRLAYNDDLRHYIRQAAGNARNIVVLQYGTKIGAMPARKGVA